MGVVVREKIKGSEEFWVFINHKGKRKALKVGDEDTAEEVAEKINARLVLGEPIRKEEPTLPTLKAYYQTFKKTYLKTALKQTTKDIYKTSFEYHILPKLGEVRIDELSRLHIKKFIAHLIEDKGLARTSIRILMAQFCAFLNHALEDGLIQKNPAAKAGKLFKQAREGRGEIEPLSGDEVILFLEAVKKHSPRYYPLFLTAIHTGLRSGELAGLKWGDIDLQGKYLIVRRNVVRGRISTTKSNKIRRVDLSDAVLAELEELRKRRKQEYLEKGKGAIPEWIFCNLEGNPAEMQNVKNRHFFKCPEKAKLRRIRFHDLRHTFVSLLLQDGQPLAYVKEQAGHSSIRLTVDIYGHLIPGANREAVNRLPSPGRNLSATKADSEAKSQLRAVV
jgi:integrase